MSFYFATFNPIDNSIDINAGKNMCLKLYCNNVERTLRITPHSQQKLDVLSVENPFEYARKSFNFELQTWIDTLDDNKTR